MRSIFITGGTGYIGKRLIRSLIERGHRVLALVRKESESKVPPGCEIIIADPFDQNTFKEHIPKDSVFIQLLGVSHPSPAKAEQFKQIDLRSVKASADAASFAGASHFIYVSVSMTPTKIMEAYQHIRRVGEEYCISKNLNCTFIRPWYVLGPGHRWPVILLPFYGIASLVLKWKKKVEGMSLVTISQMINALIKAVESGPEKIRMIEIADIKKN